MNDQTQEKKTRRRGARARQVGSCDSYPCVVAERNRWPGKASCEYKVRTSKNKVVSLDDRNARVAVPTSGTPGRHFGAVICVVSGLEVKCMEYQTGANALAGDDEVCSAYEGGYFKAQPVEGNAWQYLAMRHHMAADLEKVGGGFRTCSSSSIDPSLAEDQTDKPGQAQGQAQECTTAAECMKRATQKLESGSSTKLPAQDAPDTLTKSNAVRRPKRPGKQR